MLEAAAGGGSSRTASFSDTQDHTIQCLTSIRDSTGFSHWTRNTGGWGTLEAHRDIRRCEGVTVDQGELVGIDLEDSNLSGKMPWMAFIRLKSSLQILKLGGNSKLSPSMIPATITILRDLNVLSLHKVNLIGKILLYSSTHPAVWSYFRRASLLESIVSFRCIRGLICVVS
jgi:hypothetical protein